MTKDLEIRLTKFKQENEEMRSILCGIGFGCSEVSLKSKMSIPTDEQRIRHLIDIGFTAREVGIHLGVCGYLINDLQTIIEAQRSAFEISQSLITQWNHGKTDASRDTNLINKLGEIAEQALSLTATKKETKE